MEENRPVETSSLDAKPEEKRSAQPVANGKAVPRKKSEARKLADRFFQEDAQTVGTTLLSDVLVPSLKKTLLELITNGMEMFLYGDVSAKKKTPDRVSWREEARTPRRREEEPRRNSSDYNDIFYPTRAEAEKVLMILDEMISMYGSARVADLYSASNMTGQYTDNYYGWHDISSARVMRFQDGYLLKMPAAVPLNK